MCKWYAWSWWSFTSVLLLKKLFQQARYRLNRTNGMQVVHGLFMLCYVMIDFNPVLIQIGEPTFERAGTVEADENGGTSHYDIMEHLDSWYTPWRSWIPHHLRVEAKRSTIHPCSSLAGLRIMVGWVPKVHIDLDLCLRTSTPMFFFKSWRGYWNLICGESWVNKGGVGSVKFIEQLEMGW